MNESLEYFDNLNDLTPNFSNFEIPGPLIVNLTVTHDPPGMVGYLHRIELAEGWQENAELVELLKGWTKPAE